MVAHKITLLTGGARSGKSSKALTIAGGAKRPAFLATAQALDSEMEARIKRHKLERGDKFDLLEEPIWVGRGIAELAQTCDLVIVDCLTLWLANLMSVAESEATKALEEFEQLLKSPPCTLVIVTNELGMGLVPETAMGRDFRDKMGRLNQDVGHLADEVILMVAGQPLVIKTKTTQQ